MSVVIFGTRNPSSWTNLGTPARFSSVFGYAFQSKDGALDEICIALSRKYLAVRLERRINRRTKGFVSLNGKMIVLTLK